MDEQGRVLYAYFRYYLLVYMSTVFRGPKLLAIQIKYSYNSYRNGAADKRFTQNFSYEEVTARLEIGRLLLFCGFLVTSNNVSQTEASYA